MINQFWLSIFRSKILCFLLNLIYEILFRPAQFFSLDIIEIQNFPYPKTKLNLFALSFFLPGQPWFLNSCLFNVSYFIFIHYLEMANSGTIIRNWNISEVLEQFGIDVFKATTFDVGWNFSYPVFFCLFEKVVSVFLCPKLKLVEFDYLIDLILRI